MLAKPDAKVVFDESGKAIGVSSEGETAKCKKVVGDPSYFPGKVRTLQRSTLSFSDQRGFFCESNCQRNLAAPDPVS
jgi:RAB protein geranylgeranyltransferase component A